MDLTNVVVDLSIYVVDLTNIGVVLTLVRTFARFYEDKEDDTIRTTEGWTDGSPLLLCPYNGCGAGAAGEDQYQYASGGNVG